MSNANRPKENVIIWNSFYLDWKGYVLWLRISHREYLSEVLSVIASVYREGNQDFFRCLVKKVQAFHLVSWWLWPSRLVAFMLNELRLGEVIMWKKLWKSVWKKWLVAGHSPSWLSVLEQVLCPILLHVFKKI